MADVVKKPESETTAPERVIARQIDESGEKDARATGITKSEQPLTQTDVPDSATLARGYWKWTDNNGQFHKVPVDGTNAIREPAHEQHELTVEDRDRLYEAAALKTPRRDAAKAEDIHELNVRHDEVHDALQGPSDVEPEAKKTGPVRDGKEFDNAEGEVKVGTPAFAVRGDKQ
jgi:hypothetical protein